MDLDNLSLAELKQLQGDIAVAIFNYEKRKKAEALAAVEQVAREAGFSVAELLGASSVTKSRKKVAPKFANPSDPSQTWSGRGLKPKWLTEMLASGKTLEDAAI